jgi:hypothetical protein
MEDIPWDNRFMVVLNVVLSDLAPVPPDLFADAVHHIGFLEEGIAYVPFIS